MRTDGAEPLTLSIVIVTYNSRQDIAACLDSISRECSPSTTETLVIDNASADGTASWLSASYPGIRLTANAVNRGYAAACNQGILQSRGHYILLLNPDTIVRRGAIGTLVDHLDRDSTVWMIGPKLIYPDGSYQWPSARRLPGLATTAAWVFHISTMLALLGCEWPRAYPVPTRPLDVEAISGAAMCFPRRLVDLIGLLDETLPMGAEDIDYCARAGEAGGRVVCDPTAVIEHVEYGSMQSRPWESYIRYRQVYWFYIDKHHATAYSITTRMICAVGFAFRTVLSGLAMPLEPTNGWFRVRAYARLCAWACYLRDH